MFKNRKRAGMPAVIISRGSNCLHVVGHPLLQVRNVRDVTKALGYFV